MSKITLYLAGRASPLTIGCDSEKDCLWTIGRAAAPFNTDIKHVRFVGHFVSNYHACLRYSHSNGAWEIRDGSPSGKLSTNGLWKRSLRKDSKLSPAYRVIEEDDVFLLGGAEHWIKFSYNTGATLENDRPKEDVQETDSEDEDEGSSDKYSDSLWGTIQQGIDSLKDAPPWRVIVSLIFALLAFAIALLLGGAM